MNFEEKTKNVFYIKNLPVSLNKETVSFLKTPTREHHQKRSRICLHFNENATLHEMILSFNKQTYIPPFKQPNKSISFHVISGRGRLILFSEDGIIKKIIELGNYQSGLTFYCKLSSNVFRTVIATTNKFLFHEVIQGPFIPEENIIASWAPQENSLAAVDFLNRLKTYSNKQ